MPRHRPARPRAPSPACSGCPGSSTRTSIALPFERRTQLLALLALRRDWVSRAEAARMLWPDQADKLALTNLRKTLFRLPTLPGAPSSSRRAARCASTATPTSPRSRPRRRKAGLADALALYGGDLLAGFDDDANEAWTSWLGYERERQRVTWREAALAWLGDADVPGADAVALSARLLQATRSTSRALAGARRLAAAQPASKAAARARARALRPSAWPRSSTLAAGRTARRCSARACTGLRRPVHGTQAATRLSRHGARLPRRPGADGPRPARRGPAPPARRPATAGFIGRGRRAARDRRPLARPQTTAARLPCSAPCGSAQDAARSSRAARARPRRFADWRRVRAARRRAAMPAAAGQALHRARSSLRAEGGSDPWSTLIAELAAKRMLIVLDNLETLPGAAEPRAAPARRLPGAEADRDLARPAQPRRRMEPAARRDCRAPTSRTTTSPNRSTRCASSCAARAASTPTSRPRRKGEAVAEICRLVDGLPLAIELIAAWVRLLSCRDIVLELRAGTELLRTPRAGRPVPPREHRARVRAVVAAPRRRRAACARAPLDVPRRLRRRRRRARSIGSSLAVLGALADKSLLHQDGARLRLHPLVQQLAAARLDADDRNATEQAHSARYLQFLLGAKKDVESGDGRDPAPDRDRRRQLPRRVAVGGDPGSCRRRPTRRPASGQAGRARAGRRSS
jgi:hypothetical protein